MLFQILGMIHPMLRTVKLPSELLNKKNRVIKLRVGNPISVETQNSFADLIQYGKFLRAKTYLLGSSLEVKKFFLKSQKAEKQVEPVAKETPVEILQKEIKDIMEDYLLFSMKNYTVYCAPTMKIPNILNEIGRSGLSARAPTGVSIWMNSIYTIIICLFGTTIPTGLSGPIGWEKGRISSTVMG